MVTNPWRVVFNIWTHIDITPHEMECCKHWNKYEMTNYDANAMSTISEDTAGDPSRSFIAFLISCPRAKSRRALVYHWQAHHLIFVRRSHTVHQWRTVSASCNFLVKWLKLKISKITCTGISCLTITYYLKYPA